MLLNCGAGEESWETLGQQGDQSSQSQRKSTLNIHWKDWCWSSSSNTLATWYKELTHQKRPWYWERLKAGGEGVTEDVMVGWHNQLHGHEFEQTPRDGEGQGSFVCHGPWGFRESNLATEQQNINYNIQQKQWSIRLLYQEILINASSIILLYVCI